VIVVTELALAKGRPQVWLISHHPEVVNLLAPEYGRRFFRAAIGPTRVEAASDRDASRRGSSCGASRYQPVVRSTG
jgi:hypothetical protein